MTASRGDASDLPMEVPSKKSFRTPTSDRPLRSDAAWAGRRVTVMGLGLFGGGVGAAAYLARLGAKVTVTDLKPASALGPSIQALAGLPITFHLGRHLRSDFTRADVVVASPAVPEDSPYLELARRAGAQLTSEMNLFLAACPSRVVGVTGSNGKSTTTALLGQMLSRHVPTHVGGNIGKSLLDELAVLTPRDTVVLELSSFQLDDLAALRRSPHVAVVTNISPNHLDRHRTMAAYVRAKKNILRFQGPDDVAVLNADDAEVRSWRRDVRGRAVMYSVRRRLRGGVFADAGCIVFRLEGREERLDLGRPGSLKLRGRHNLQNVLAAATAARVLGVPVAKIAAALRAFKPLPHRLQPVGTRRGVLYVNDSKATTPEAARVAIEAFDEPVILIAGGYDKHLDPEPMVRAIRRRAKAVVLIGQTAGMLEARIGRRGPPVERASTLPEAVARAAARARRGDVVLLAPGHASWDMFENYEQRGEVFRRAVEAFA